MKWYSASASGEERSPMGTEQAGYGWKIWENPTEWSLETCHEFAGKFMSYLEMGWIEEIIPDPNGCGDYWD